VRERERACSDECANRWCRDASCEHERDRVSRAPKAGMEARDAGEQQPADDGFQRRGGNDGAGEQCAVAA